MLEPYRLAQAERGESGEVEGERGLDVAHLNSEMINHAATLAGSADSPTAFTRRVGVLRTGQHPTVPTRPSFQTAIASSQTATKPTGVAVERSDHHQRLRP